MSNKNEEWRTIHMPEINEMLIKLYTKFPQAFSTDEQQVKPLKMGIYEDLKVALGLKGNYQSEARKQKRLLREALKLYSESPAYLKKISQQLYRIDLEGKRTEKVTEEYAKIATMMLEKFESN